MTQKHTFKRRFGMMLVIIGGIGVVIGIGAASHIANAAVNMSYFSNQLTNPSDMMAGGTQGAIDLHLKNVSDIAKVRSNNMAVYFPSSVKTTNGLELKILDGRKGRVCNINTAVATGNVKISITTQAGTSSYLVSVKDVCSTNKFFGKTIKFSGKPIWDGEAGLSKAEIRIEFTGDPKSSSDLQGSDRYSLNYNLKLAGANSSKAKLAMVAVGGSEDSLGLRSSYQGRYESASDRQVRAGIVFGFPCNVTPSSLLAPKRAVQIYDADGVFGQTFMWVERLNSSNNWVKMNRSDYSISESNRIESWDSGRNAWLLEPTNNQWNILVLKPEALSVNGTYRVQTLNTGKKANGTNSAVNPHGNTLSLKIPFDSIYGSGKCNYSLTPNVNPPSDSSETYVEGSVVPVTGHVTVDGFDNDTHDWALSVRVYGDKPGNRAQAVNGNSPCSWKGGRAGSCNDALASDNRRFNNDFSVSRNFDTTGIEAGDWVCFMMSVRKPSYNAPNGRWAHSPMKCVGIRGDVSGTTVDPLTYSYYPELTATSVIDNLGEYPKIDVFFDKDFKREYPWEIFEAKFTAQPTGTIGPTDGSGCSNIESDYSSTYIAGSCRKVSEGEDLFPNNDPKQIKTVTESKDTPDPIGTWTCYTLRYLNNPEPSQDLINDILKYVGDNNDDDSISQDSRWTDERNKDHYHSPVYNEDGDIIGGDFYHWHGPTKSFNTIYNPYASSAPDTSPESHTYTEFNRASCSVSGIYPKVQILGGDLRVGGDVTAATTRINPPAQYRGLFGSFGEYGVLSSSGLIRGIGSGAGLNGGGAIGSQPIDWSTLTFSNIGSDMGYSGLGVTTSFNYTNPIEIEGDLTVNSINDLYTPESRRLVYEVNGDVYITGNLAYGNNYNTTEQLPRIAIKANNIIIAPGVDRIDPWLVADDVLNTCGDASFLTAESQTIADAALTTTDAHNSACDNNGVPLVFNGPVIAGRVFLLRTTGSRDSFPAPSADGKRTLSQPAEIFNLRPDAFLSSFSNNVTPNPVAVTDRVIDLPPRF